MKKIIKRYLPALSQASSFNDEQQKMISMYIAKIISYQIWVNKHKLPDVTDMFLGADLNFAMLVQQPLLLAHTQLTFAGQQANFEKATIATGPEGLDPPGHLVFTSNYYAFLVCQKPLSEGVVNIDNNGLIMLLVKQFLVLMLVLKGRALSLDELPDIVLWDVVGVVGTAGDFIEKFALRKFNFMGVQVVFCFEVAENDTIVDRVGLALGIDLMQRLIKYFQFVLFHFHHAAHEHLAVFVGQTGDGLVKVFAEGGVDVGGEAGVIYAIFFVNDGRGFIAFSAFVADFVRLLVGLPLLLL